MANFFESGFTVLQALAEEKLNENKCVCGCASHCGISCMEEGCDCTECECSNCK